jgi:uncharacterized protein YuzE
MAQAGLYYAKVGEDIDIDLDQYGRFIGLQ